MQKVQQITTSNPKHNILLLSQSPPCNHLRPLLSLHFNLITSYDSPLPLPDFLAAAAAAGVSAVITDKWGPPIKKDTVLLPHLTTLKCIVVVSTGTNYIDLDECRRRGIAVANAGDAYSDDCADMAIALLLSVVHKISMAKCMDPFYKRLAGKRVGIVGLGSIGSRIAKRLEAFGCVVSYTSRKQKDSIPYPFYSDVSNLTSHCNILILCCELTHKTKHMINNQVLSSLGEDGILINIARGSIVDEKELVRCLIEGKIAGAGLDVFEDEPVTSTELCGFDNVVLSPHRGFSTQESFGDVFELIKANFNAFFAGKPLLSSVF